MKAYNYLLLLFLLPLFGACTHSEPVAVTKTDTVYVKEIPKPQPAARVEKSAPAPKPETAPAPPAPVAKPAPNRDWEVKMKEYHEIRCRQKSGNVTLTDGVRQVELYKELMDLRKGMDKDERFYFATALAKAEDMSTCGK